MPGYGADLAGFDAFGNPIPIVPMIALDWLSTIDQFPYGLLLSTLSEYVEVPIPAHLPLPNPLDWMVSAASQVGGGAINPASTYPAHIDMPIDQTNVIAIVIVPD